MLSPARLSQLLACIALFGAFYASVPAHAALTESAAFESYLREKNEKGHLPLELELRDEATNSEDVSPSEFYSPTATRDLRDFRLIAPGKLPASATLREGGFEKGLPVLELDAGPERYRLFFGEWIFSELAATKIERALGYYAPSIDVVRGFKVYLGKLSKEDFLRYWSHSGNLASLRGMISEIQEDAKGSYFVADRALLEFIPKNSEDLQDGWKWGSPLNLEKRREYRALLGLALWLQNGDLSEAENNATRLVARKDGHRETVHFLRSLRFSFGASKFISTPNLFGTEAVQKASEVRAQLQRGKSVRVMLRLSPYGSYREIFSQTTLGDLQWIIGRMSQLNESQLIEIFRESQYPEAVARLLSAKLIARLNNLREAFLLSDSAPIAGTSPASIQDGTFILNGEVRNDYPGFPLDLTTSARERAFQLVWNDIGKAFDTVVLGVLGNFPTKALQLDNLKISFSKYTGSPGWYLKAKRTIRQNDTPTGLNDLFLVRDEVTFSLSFGLGLENVFGSPLWANVSPSWDRSWAIESPAANEHEARATPWLIPWEAIHETDFSRLQKNQMLAIQNGLTLAFATGAGIKAMPKQFQTGAYASVGASYINGFEVHRNSDGNYLIFDDSTKQVQASSKMYLQLLTKYIRVPMARASIAKGWAHGNIFFVDEMKLSPESRMEFDYALRSTDTDGLPRYFPPIQTKSEYELAQAKFEFFILNGGITSSEDDQAMISPSDNSGESRYVHVSRESRNFGITIGADEVQSCQTVGVVEYADKSRTTVKDRYLESTCKVRDNDTSSKEMLSYLDEAKQATGGRLDFSSIENSVDKEERLGRSQLKVTLRMYDDQILRFLSHKPIEIARPQLPHQAYDYELAALFNEKNEDDRMDRLVKIITKKRFDNSFRRRLIAKIPDLSLKAEIGADAFATTANPKYEFKTGKNRISSAQQYLNDAAPIGVSSYFIEY